MRGLRLGMVQAYFGASKDENLRKIRELVIRGHGSADLVVLPEYSMANPLALGRPEDFWKLAEDPLGGPFARELSSLSAEIGAPILAHVVEAGRGKPYSASVLVQADHVRVVYRKMHLFDAYGYSESSYFERGDGPGEVFEIGGARLAVAVCYDLRFPELFRRYALAGASLVVVQAGWVAGPLKEHLLDVLATARAHENTIFLAVANQSGPQFTGRSGIFSPFGLKTYDAGPGEKYFEVELDLGEVERARSAIPALKQSSERWRVELAAQPT
ncbi:MAG: carbon-nitrogen hydrolase family protein [Desulfurococcaceae archaeon]